MKKHIQFSLIILFLLYICIPVAKAQFSKRELKIAVLLPFCTDLSKQEIAKKKLAGVQKIALEYYQGLCIAVDSLENLGIVCKVKVYDTNKDSLSTLKILNKPEIQSMNLIVGPLFKEGIDMVAKFCLSNKIYHLSPMVSVASSVTTPYLINTNTDVSNYYKGLIDFLHRDFDSANIYIIHDGKKTTKLLSENIQHILDSNPIVRIKFIKEIKSEDIICYDKQAAVLLMLSNDENWVNQQMLKLKDLENFSLMGLESWLGFKSPDYDRWLNYHCMFAVSNHINIEKSERFRKLFRNKYYTEPDETSYKGFDQLMFIGTSTLNDSSVLFENIDNSYNALHNIISLEQDPKNKQWINFEMKVLRLEEKGLMKVYR